MLTDPMIQLLTAFVDGELNHRQRDEVLQLLNKSSEARELLCQLQENAHKIKKLPRRQVEPSLVEQIVQAIEEQKAQVKPAASATLRRRTWLPYVVASMAAMVLIGSVGVVALLAVIDTFKNNHKGELPFVQNPKPDPTPTPEPSPPTPKKVNPLLAQMTEAVVRDFAAPPPPDRVFTASFAELRKGTKASSQLVYEFNHEKSVQLDVTVKKNSDALARLQSVLKYQNVKLITDPAAKKAVDDKKAEYIVYAENLTTAELTKLLNELSEAYVVPGTT